MCQYSIHHAKFYAQYVEKERGNTGSMEDFNIPLYTHEANTPK